MADITRTEFSKIYRGQFVPILEQLESERVVLAQKTKMYIMFSCLFVVMFIISFIYCSVVLNVSLFLIIIFCFLIFYLCSNKLYRNQVTAYKTLKEKFLAKILNLYGQFYLSDVKCLIGSEEIMQMGLFPRFMTKKDSDVIVGNYKNCEIIIDDCLLTHGKDNKCIDFYGLIVKISMNKTFSGKTIVGKRNFTNKMDKYEEVKLEDVEYMRNMIVYSTDQIEARYILTTAFIERLRLLGQAFFTHRNKNRVYENNNKILKFASTSISKLPGVQEATQRAMLVKSAFIDGYVYLFVPTGEDFFEVDINTSLLNEDKYFDIYNQFQSILSIVDYLKLDLKLGL